MIHPFGSKTPNVDTAAFVAWNATVIGDVVLGELSSIWFSATLRGDIERIAVGVGANVQDSATLHTEVGFPCEIGDDVTIGHNAVVHGCRIGDRSLIGMGAVILNGAVIGSGCIVGASALVTEGKSFPDRTLILGSPAKVVREVTDAEYQGILDNASRYRERAIRMKDAGASSPS